MSKQTQTGGPSSSLGISRVFSDKGPMFSPEMVVIVAVIFALGVIVVKLVAPL